MYCSQCGLQAEDLDTYCGGCGSKLFRNEEKDSENRLMDVILKLLDSNSELKVQYVDNMPEPVNRVLTLIVGILNNSFFEGEGKCFNELSYKQFERLKDSLLLTCVTGYLFHVGSLLANDQLRNRISEDKEDELFSKWRAFLDDNASALFERIKDDQVLNDGMNVFIRNRMSGLINEIEELNDFKKLEVQRLEDQHVHILIFGFGVGLAEQGI